MTALIDVQSNASENPLPDNRKYKMIAEDVSDRKSTRLNSSHT